MTFPENATSTISSSPSVGGADYVPPTLGPRAANTPANNAANVECTGGPRSHVLDAGRVAGRLRQNRPVSGCCA